MIRDFMTSCASRRRRTVLIAGISAAMPGATKARLIGELLRLVSGGELKLPVEAVFGLDQIADAVTASLSPGKAGKVLLKP